MLKDCMATVSPTPDSRNEGRKRVWQALPRITPSLPQYRKRTSWSLAARDSRTTRRSSRARTRSAVVGSVGTVDIGLLLRAPALVALAQDLLVELADARLGDGVDDLHGVGERPLRELRPEKLEDLGGIDGHAGLGHDAGERPFDPPRMRNGDDRGLQHLGMRHDHRLHVDRRDPLA